MGWPQITMIVLLTLSFGITLAKHGEPRSDHNAAAALVGLAIHIGLLYAGGFFS